MRRRCSSDCGPEAGPDGEVTGSSDRHQPAATCLSPASPAQAGDVAVIVLKFDTHTSRCVASYTALGFLPNRGDIVCGEALCHVHDAHTPPTT